MCLILDSAIACSVEERGIDFRIDTPCVAVSFLKLSERKQLAASHRMAEGGDREVKASSILTHTSSAEVVFFPATVILYIGIHTAGNHA